MVYQTPRDVVGKCTACGGALVKETDAEKRLWARCVSCSARCPLESGLHIVDETKGANS